MLSYQDSFANLYKICDMAEFFEPAKMQDFDQSYWSRRNTKDGDYCCVLSLSHAHSKVNTNTKCQKYDYHQYWLLNKFWDTQRELMQKHIKFLKVNNR